MAFKYNVVFLLILCITHETYCSSKPSFFKRCFGIFKRKSKQEPIPVFDVEQENDTHQTTQGNISPAKVTPDHTIRVLLVEKKESAEWQLSAPHGFIIANGFTNKKKKSSQTMLQLGFKNGALRVNNRSIKETYLKIEVFYDI